MHKITKFFSIFLLILGLARCDNGENPGPKSDFGHDADRDIQNTDVQRPNKDMGGDATDLPDLDLGVTRDTSDLETSLDMNLDTYPDTSLDMNQDANPDISLDVSQDTYPDMGLDVSQDTDLDTSLDMNQDTSPDTNLDMNQDSGSDSNQDIPDSGPRPENAPRFPLTFIERYGDIVNHQNTHASNFILERLTIVDGSVLDDVGDPLAGVKISAPDFPDIGFVLSDTDGNFAFALNGGGVVNLRYTKTGFIDSERRVQSLWNEFVHIGPLVLKEYSQTVTTISFSNANQIQVARGDIETDCAGTRQATILVNSNTNAMLKLKDGTTVDMPSLNIRFTEFTVGTAGPLAMPGDLPGTSAYTYAVEISADEAVAMDAVSVEFDKPVYFYVEDFIGFPVGTVVPIGYYSREKHAWIPSDNGKVISIVSIVNRKATIDIDGDGSADTGTALTDLGFSDDELSKLASLYTPGKVLWRGPMTHLTPWDCNWPYGPPPDAIFPDPFKNPKKPRDKNCEESGSIIECESGILRESLGISGTPFFLNYSSYNAHYAPAYEIEIPLITEQVPDSLDCALITVEVAGRIFHHGLSREDVQKADVARKYVFRWDGKDLSGAPIQGTKRYTAKLDFFYKPYYYPDPIAFARAFGSASNTGSGTGGSSSSSTFITRFSAPNTSPATFTGERCSGTLIDASSRSRGRIGRFVRGEGIGGWTLSEHHSYDRLSKMV